tara:strand:- start:563 stop:1534 length:972 start_codon:yes stop_codon:yes gene_type:complete
MAYFTIILQTDQQAKEGLWIAAILIIFMVVVGIWAKNKEYNEREYLERKLNADDGDKKYDNSNRDRDKAEIEKKLNVNKIITDEDFEMAEWISDISLINRLRERRVKQDLEKEENDLKDKADKFSLKEYSNSDLSLKKYFLAIENQICVCNKCNYSYMRIWNLNTENVELRCENCKKKHLYGKKSLEGISLVRLDKLLDLNIKRHNESLNNPYIRKSSIDLDFNGLKSNSPKWYVYTLKPKLEAKPNKRNINVEDEDFRSRRISQEVKDAVWNRDKGKCVECGSNKKLEFDHIIPFSKGGSNTYRNLQLLCENCNRTKSDKIG